VAPILPLMAEGAADTVWTAITEAINDHGPISFAEFMDLALYAPGGYYDHPPVGPAGDFVTSPHVHRLFGRLLAEAIRGLHDTLGAPDPFDLIEVGAGDGTLLRQVLPELTDLPIRATAVERSAGARAALADIADLTVESDLADAPNGGGVVLAHELLDNLAFSRFRGTDAGMREVRVAVDGARLVEHLAVPEHPPWPWPGTSLPPGHERILPTAARDLVVQSLAGTEGPRFLLAIDFGSEADDAGEVHGYRAHHVLGDVLAAPGTVDITAGVPFGDLRRHAAENGLRTFPTVSQRQALRGLGFGGWFSSTLERQADLLNTGRGATASRLWAERSQAGLLVDPMGLGRFRWLVVGTAGLSEPEWLGRARLEA
jgi:NADH dehydrogenase [ubiquinone] 1 alpha subcomplex assembly factor 7